MPTRIVAPVGSEVLMVAGVHGPGEPNMPRQRVEWLLAPGSVGHFLAVAESEQPRFLRFGSPPQKVSNDYAVSETQSTAHIITRGTADPRDDVSVLPGQAWVTVASPIEGISYVTAFAPDIQGVVSNRQSGEIHWVDVRWTAPLSASVPVGEKHPLVTSVLRASNGAPIAGYKVHLEFAGGVDAGFGPSLSGGVELTTNEQGQASAELAERTAAPGITQVNVQLIRPGIAGSEPLILGSTTTSITWMAAAVAQPALPGVAVPGGPIPGAVNVTPSVPGAVAPPSGAAPPRLGPPPTNGASPGPAALEVRTTGPDRPVEVGSRVEFRIDIANRGSTALQNIAVLDRFGPGLKHDIASSPIRPKQIVGELAPGQTYSLKLSFTVVDAGRHCHTVEVTADGGTRAVAEGCVTATAAAGVPTRPSVSVRKVGPKEMKVGDVVLIKSEITNTSTMPITALRVTDSWRGGLQPTRATDGNQRTGENELTWQYDKPVPAGDKVVFEVEYRATAPQSGSCSRATVSGAGGVAAADELCVEITGAGNANVQGKLSVLVSDRADPVPVGTPYSYRIVVRNDGTTPQTNVVVVLEVPDTLQIELAQGPVKSVTSGQTVRFDPVLSLEPATMVSYELRVKPTRAGKVIVRAQATSQTITEPTAAEHDTQILSSP